MTKMMATLLAGAMLMMATSAMATTYTVGGVVVGAVDTHLATTTLGEANGYDAELAWVNRIVSPDYASFVKYDGEDDNPAPWTWTFVDGSGSIVATNLVNAPDYYFIKIGTGSLGLGNGQNAIDHYLFQNDTSSSWAVVDLATSFDSPLHDISLLNTGDIGKFSHEGEFGGGTPVPEPGTMMLLGMGMLGLAVYGKRRMNK